MEQAWIKPFKEIYNFVHWWSVVVPSGIFNVFKLILLTVDDSLDLGSNIRLWVAIEPLFGDYTWQGRLSGFFLRGVRVIASTLAYLAILLLGLVSLVAWFGLIILIGWLIF